MAESNRDDLADALARLAGGDVAPSEREHDDHAAPAPPPRPPAVKPTSRPPAPVTARPPGLRPPVPTARPAGSSAPRPAPIPPPTIPARPQRPDVPTIARPAAPSAAPPQPAPPVEFTTLGDDPAVIDDDDAVIVPPPDPSVFAHRKSTTTAEARARVARRKRIDFRQTAIPILLTGGTLLMGFGLAPMAFGPGSVAANLPTWITPTLVGGGLLLWALAVANMVSVRALLAEHDGPGS